MKRRQQSTHTTNIQKRRKVWWIFVRAFDGMTGDWVFNIFCLTRIFENDSDDVPFAVSTRSQPMYDPDLTMFASDHKNPLISIVYPLSGADMHIEHPCVRPKSIAHSPEYGLGDLYKLEQWSINKISIDQHHVDWSHVHGWLWKDRDFLNVQMVMITYCNLVYSIFSHVNDGCSNDRRHNTAPYQPTDCILSMLSEELLLSS